MDNILEKKKKRETVVDLEFLRNDTLNEIFQQWLERLRLVRYFVRATRSHLDARGLTLGNSWTAVGNCRRRWTSNQRNEASRDFLFLLFFLGRERGAVSDRVPGAIRGRPRGINDAGEIQFGVGGHKGVTERGGIYYHGFPCTRRPPPSPPPPPSAN